MLFFIIYLLNYNNYILYRKYIKLNNDNKELYILYKELDYLIDNYKRDITLDEYKIHVLTKYPDYDVFLEQLDKADVSQEFLLDKLKELQEQQLAYDLALIAVDVSEGRKSIEAVFDFYTKFDKLDLSTEKASFVTDDLDELYHETVQVPGLRWRLKALNKSLGSLRKGDFGFLFARPETGKTTFLASEISYFAEQTDKPILWFNNEEQGNKVKIRLYQAALGQFLVDLYSDRKKAYNNYMALTGGRIKIYDSASIHKKQVERIIKEVDPACIIFDQIDKIKGFDSDREDLRLGAIYIWARELAKEYCPTIGVCQADVSGEGKKWLTMDNVANAKCLAPQTLVLMYNGDWKAIADIKVGEQVMGPDSTPRNVLSIANGVEEMFRVRHKIGGDFYEVNKSHLLCLVDQYGKYKIKNVLDYNQFDFGYRIGHELPEEDFSVDPYFLGLWLGDGKATAPEITTMDIEIKEYVANYAKSIDCTYTEWQNGVENPLLVQAKIKYRQGIKHPLMESIRNLNLEDNKHIPAVYFKGSIKQRLSLIAGLLDTDGTLVKRKHEYYMFSNKNYDIAYGLKCLALSCGLMATFKQKEKYYYVTISGNDLSVIPCKIKRKQSTYKTYKDVLKSRLIIESLGIGPYTGFVLDGDHQFIIEGNIVTHNTSKQAEADWILGIGKVHDPGFEYVRYLHLSKNKLAGDEDSDPNLRHGRLEVIIQPTIARYGDID